MQKVLSNMQIYRARLGSTGDNAASRSRKDSMRARGPCKLPAADGDDAEPRQREAG